MARTNYFWWNDDSVCFG